MKDVVVTGIGVVSSIGNTVDEYWNALLSGRTGIRNATPEEFGSDNPGLWAPIVDDFTAEEQLDPKVVAGSDRHVHMLMVAAERAVRHSGLETLDPYRTGVFTGTAMGGLNTVIEGQQAYDVDGPDAVPKKVQIKMWPNMGAAQLSYRWQLHGPQLTVCTACASSVDSVGIGARHVETGIADVAIVGGSDAYLKPLILLSAGGLGAGSTSSVPERSLMPFDKNRDGMVVGEGSGVMVLESRRHAKARGANILASVRGYGSLADSYHPSSPNPTGEWQNLAMSQALSESGMAISDIAGVVAHGTGTKIGDISELRALNRYLGDHAPAVKVSSLKGHLGHTSGAAGVMSLIAAVKGIETGEFMHNMGTTDPEEEARFEVVTRRPTKIDAGAVQVNAFGFGGQNASVILSRD